MYGPVITVIPLVSMQRHLIPCTSCGLVCGLPIDWRTCLPRRVEHHNVHMYIFVFIILLHARTGWLNCHFPSNTPLVKSQLPTYELKLWEVVAHCGVGLLETPPLFTFFRLQPYLCKLLHILLSDPRQLFQSLSDLTPAHEARFVQIHGIETVSDLFVTELRHLKRKIDWTTVSTEAEKELRLWKRTEVFWLYFTPVPQIC